MIGSTLFLQELTKKHGGGSWVNSFEEAQELPVAELYDLLESYYLSNGLYWVIEQTLFELSHSQTPRRSIRNPAHAVVEFYAAKLWPGSLEEAFPLVLPNEALRDHIKQILTWSNWASQKQVFARKLSLLGDVFLKASVNPTQTRVFIQLIDPRDIPDDGFEVDERGFLTYLRIDIYRPDRNAQGKLEDRWWTEIWQKSPAGPVSVTVYDHDQGRGADLEDLGDPIFEKHSSYGFDELDPEAVLPFDFIPVVHIKFQDIGQPRGLGAFVHALDKIDEANLLATRLHQLIYNNDAVWALRANQVDPTGRPVPAPLLKNDETPDTTTTPLLGGMRVVRLPGQSALEPLIPTLPFSQLLEIVRDQVVELQRDLPELRYSLLSAAGQELSGRALELLLGDAVDKALEARGNGEAGLIRVIQMLLTMGQAYELFPSTLGTYEEGKLDFSFQKRPLIPSSTMDDLTSMKTGYDAGIPVDFLAEVLGWSPELVKKLRAALKAQSKTDQENLATSVLTAMAKTTGTPPIDPTQTPKEGGNSDGSTESGGPDESDV